ncbi:MAG: 30S ribosomal protein S7 [Spirochaetes bacterium RBG_13_68_11]|jgi:small subunit ribosomal protein S7|nr:MAG: 30S ribosomal protein S7 [Spirochaetes bacterium RBG_13_68_11]
MPRGQLIRKRKVVLDPRYKNPVIEKFITRMMLQGKKNIATHIIYGALDIVTKKVGKDAVEVFQKALDNVKPVVEVKSRRVGGATLQVPVEIREERRDALGMRWLISFSRGRKGRSMAERLSAELIDAYNNTGSAVKKKEDTHKMAEANKAFAHYRW